jgi:putative Mg2+ transporter-C (MgtC) family protein
LIDLLEQLEISARLAYAVLLGSVIGLQRELRGYPAGVRTFALVSLGAALFTEVSRVTGDADRIAAGIVTGIGFLGAGMILREGQSVRGVTTAATIWASAAVGMAVSLELFFVAGITTFVVFLLLESRPVIRSITEAIRKRIPGAGEQEENTEQL